MIKMKIGTRVLSRYVNGLKGTVEKVLENYVDGYNYSTDYIISWDIGTQSHERDDGFTAILKKDGSHLMSQARWYKAMRQA